MLKNVLRYPGGKSKALKYILPNLPVSFKEYREPMVGGGAVALAVKQLYTNVKVKINDLNYDLICFWKQLRDNPVQLIEEVSKIKESYKDGRKLYEFLTAQNSDSEFERAVRFYVLNRITFSGTVDSGGYSQQSFENRFTWSAINKLKQAAEIIKDFEISHGDYEKLLFEPGDKVFIFLDPPYFSTTESRLYGKNGDLHLNFDHERFAFNMKKCPHLWMITYDDSSEVRKLFRFANIYEWELQYGMNNYKQPKAEKGKELFITNYKLEELHQKEKYALGL